MVCIACLNNLLPGFPGLSPKPSHSHTANTIHALLSAGSFDEIKTACLYVSSLSRTVARNFPQAFISKGVGDLLVDILMEPIPDELYLTDFPFALVAHIKSWTGAGAALLAMIKADNDITGTDLGREGISPAVVAALTSVLDVMNICTGNNLAEVYSPALVKHVRSACLESLSLLVRLHHGSFRTYAFSNSEVDAQLALLAEHLLRIRGSVAAHEHGIYILDAMCIDLKASMFLLNSSIAPALEDLLGVYLECDTRANLEKVALKLTRQILAPAETVIPFSAPTAGQEHQDLEAVIERIKQFDLNKERGAERSCQLLLKALQEQQ